MKFEIKKLKVPLMPKFLCLFNIKNFDLKSMKNAKKIDF